MQYFFYFLWIVGIEPSKHFISVTDFFSVVFIPLPDVLLIFADEIICKSIAFYLYYGEIFSVFFGIIFFAVYYMPMGGIIIITVLSSNTVEYTVYKAVIF